MPVNRLPFAIEDLASSIRSVCGDSASISIVVDQASYRLIKAELAHTGHGIRIDNVTIGTWPLSEAG